MTYCSVLQWDKFLSKKGLTCSSEGDVKLWLELLTISLPVKGEEVLITHFKCLTDMEIQKTGGSFRSKT